MPKRSGFALLAVVAFAADRPSVPQLIEMARHQPAGLEEALRATLGDEKLKKGTAFAGEGPEFIFAIESAVQPELFVDDRPEAAMDRVGKTNLWFQTAALRPGTVHGFYYTVNGARTGGS